MDFKNYRPIVELTALSVSAFLGHMLFFYFLMKDKSMHFHYSPFQLYGFFFCFSIVIISILMKMKRKNIDSVGNTFMLLTSVKLVVAYFLLRPILINTHQYHSAEKANFFLIFALFLTFETIATIRMLNKS